MVTVVQRLAQAQPWILLLPWFLGFAMGVRLLYESTPRATEFVEVRRARIESLAPPSLSRFAVSAEGLADVPFAWKVIAPGGEQKKDRVISLFLELSPEASFGEEGLTLYPLSPTGKGVTLKLRPGAYFWRIKSAEGEMSEPRQLTVWIPEPPKRVAEPIRPAEKTIAKPLPRPVVKPVVKAPRPVPAPAPAPAKIFLVAPASSLDFQTSDALEFSWRDVRGSGEEDLAYQWELARDERFQDKVTSIRTRGTRVAGDQWPRVAGSYYWKVSLVRPDGRLVAESPTRIFSLKESVPARPRPVKTKPSPVEPALPAPPTTTKIRIK